MRKATSLKEAVFKIADQNGNTVQEELVSDRNGTVTASGLAAWALCFRRNESA
ncbi:SpaA isopeptide-forming pilin-related protein [Bacillus licheniformis]